MADREVLLGDIGSALRDEQFVLHYQPKVHLASGRPAGVEALVRWQHPQFGLLPPDRFLSLIEQSGNMDWLTVIVINAALDRKSTRLNSSHPSISYAVFC